MKRFLHRSVLVLGLLQATSLFAVPLQSFEVRRDGGGQAQGEFVLSESGTPMLHMMRCNFQAQNTTLEMTDPTQSALVASILHGDYTITNETPPQRRLPTGSWVHAAYTIAGQDKVEVRGYPVFLKDGQPTHAFETLLSLVQEMCQPVHTEAL